MERRLILSQGISDGLLVDLDQREVAVWVRSLPTDATAQKQFSAFLGLPWRMVLSEVSDSELLDALDRHSQPEDPMTLKRGFVQIVDGDPSRIELPSRCLPVYLLNGRDDTDRHDFGSRLRRITMVEELRRSGVRRVLVISGNDDPRVSEITELWSAGFRSFLTFVSDATDARQKLEIWFEQNSDLEHVELIQESASRTVSKLLDRYIKAYPEEAIVLRLRDSTGNFQEVDITGIDDPDRPIFDQYSVIQERHVSMLTPDQISEDEFIKFFRDPEASWRPYAAGLPWQRQNHAINHVKDILERLETAGAQENCVAYVLSEPGAGGTTFVRMLAWECARIGYPSLVANQFPFVPDALSVANFLNRVRGQQASAKQTRPGNGRKEARREPEEPDGSLLSRRYETPWLIVFDRAHWEHRDGELRRFRNEMERQGRPVCVLVVAGPVRELSYFDSSIFLEIATLTHTLSPHEARQLGQHLNSFLRNYGKARGEGQWDNFYQNHSVRYLGGESTFWIALSFWVQGQYDLSETIQEWMYRTFKAEIDSDLIQRSILEIAAMSSERLPLPEGLLPSAAGEWPVAHLLEDHRQKLGALGLVRISALGQKHWALLHDILGRFLINATFHDYPMRLRHGFGEATAPEHLRLLILIQISKKRELGERAYREIGDDFATTIFKIDPDHGHGSFATNWREALDALDHMAVSLKDTSRVFRHHTAVSRRRIAILNEDVYHVRFDDRKSLLRKAIDDIKYALSSIEYTPGSEPNINLYNSLAHAYHDLADLEEKVDTAPESIAELRRLARAATRQAYEESPTNSFVIETYVRDLLTSTRTADGSVIEVCIEALGILYSAISSNEDTYRKAHLGDLADEALAILFTQVPNKADVPEPSTPIDVLTNAWIKLAEGVDYSSGTALLDLPLENRANAISALEHQAGRGNMQVIRLSYELVSLTYPEDVARQLEYLEQLQATDYHTTPQLRLEYAILLYQTNRAVEGDRAFRQLRRLWRTSEQFVRVPSRLRWLRDRETGAVRVVRATIASDREFRPMAMVRELRNLEVPFRSEEFSLREVRPGARFSCRVSFGHNGPFLRPVTVRTG